MAAARREQLTAAEVHAVVDLMVACSSRPQVDFILHHPRREIRQSQIDSLPAWDPRLSAAGNRDGAIVLEIEGRSYRASRAQQPAKPTPAQIPKPKRQRKATG